MGQVFQLYNLTHHGKKIEEAIELFADQNGGLVPEDLDQILGAITEEKAEVIEACIQFLRNVEAKQQAFENEAKVLKSKALGAGLVVEKMKKHLLKNIADGEKIQAGLWTVSKRKNPHSLEFKGDERDSQYIDFVEYRPVLDKNKLKTAIKAGEFEESDECKLVQTESLIVK